MWTFRQATIADASAIARAESETAEKQEGLLAAQPQEIPLGAYQQKIERLQTQGLFSVLENEGRMIGHVILEPFGLAALRHVVQLTIVVHPPYVGHGWGKRLMEYAIAWARGLPEVEKIELRVRSTNLRALRLYEALGFVVEGRLIRRIRLKNGYADDICMALFVKDVTPEST
jgi:RimJ/RimL family protein N-acetyltransferase